MWKFILFGAVTNGILAVCWKKAVAAGISPAMFNIGLGSMLIIVGLSFHWAGGRLFSQTAEPLISLKLNSHGLRYLLFGTFSGVLPV